MAAFDIKVTGDVAGVLTLPKQIPYAAARTINDGLDRAQQNIDKGLHQRLHIRNGWTKSRTRYGINITYAKPTKLQGAVHTAADWLLEEEGYDGGVKHKDKPGTYLAIPSIENTRHGLMNKVAAAEKVWRLLAQGQASQLGNLGGKRPYINPLTKQGKQIKAGRAFILISKKGVPLVFERVGADKNGGARRGKKGNPLRQTKNGKSTLVLKYVFKRTVKVPELMIFTTTALKTLNASHLQQLLGKNLAIAIKTAKI